MNKKISINSGIGTVEYTKSEIEQALIDLDFLRNAVLTVLNPSVSKKYDFDFDYETTVKYLHEYYKEDQYLNQDCIDDIFKDVLIKK